MIPVLSRAQMRAFDAHAIRSGVPSLDLMENAGRNATTVLERELLSGHAAGKDIRIVCGTGNNGGDGFVMARHLAKKGARVSVFLCGDPSKLSPDAKTNLDAFRACGGDLAPSLDLAGADAIVDALFGTGLDRVIAGAAHDAIGAINDAHAPVFAVDIPSGIDCDTGAVLGIAVRARCTATFALPKLGLLTPVGAEHAGAVSVVDIGAPRDIVDHTGHDADLLEDSDIASLLSSRLATSHKYRSGHVGILAGSAGKVGASLLVAHGALRAGAGAVTICTWADAAQSLESRVLEAMTARIDPADITGSLDRFIAGKRAIVMGCGFGVTDVAARAMAHVAQAFDGTLVVDADALTAIANGAIDPSKARARLVATPHAGEAHRILGAEVDGDRYGSVRTLADRIGVAVLKGAHTLVAKKGSRTVVCPKGTPALATAGSGDVLAGIIGALACEADAFEAAFAGAYLHACAGAAWAARTGSDRGMLAHEIGDELPVLIARLCG